MKNYIDLESKYSPNSLPSFVFPNSQVKASVMSYAAGTNKKPLLLYGPNGTGKSKLTHLIPNEIEKGQANIHTVKAVDINNAEGIKLLEQVKLNSASCIGVGLFGNSVMNYCVIEEYEIDLSTKASLKVMLDNKVYNDLTMITSNHYHKIDTGIKSRCKCVYVPPVPPEIFLPFASKIVKSEGIVLLDSILLKLLESVYRKYADNRKYYEILSDFVSEKHNS